MSALLYSVRRSVRRTARSVAFSGIAAILLLVGIAFLTTAGWMLIAASYGALFANAVIGGIFVGLGLIFLAFSFSSPRPRHHHVPPAPVDPTAHMIAQLTEGFVTGMKAGRATRR